MTKLRLAIVGFGKIATVRHVPAIAATPGVDLVAIADPKATSPDVPNFPSLEALLRDGPPIDAVTLCSTTPARELGLIGHGVLATDAVADLVVLDARLSVVQTYVAGELVYSRQTEGREKVAKLRPTTEDAEDTEDSR